MSQIWHLNYMLMTSYQEEKLQMSERKIYDWKGLCMLTELFLTTVPSFFLSFLLAYETQNKTQKQNEELGEPLTFEFDFSAPGHELKTKQILLQRGLSNAQTFNDPSVNIFLIHF